MLAIFIIFFISFTIISLVFALFLLYIISAYIILFLKRKGIAGLFFSFVHIVSGEFLLKHISNGGSSVIARTIFSGSIISLIVIIAHYIVYLEVQSPFSIMRANGWQFCGIYAATYASFYARFVSQWTYLSNLYNQIKEAELNLSPSPKPPDALLHWMAGFIEDAENLHLDTKSIFSTIIINWSKKYPDIEKIYNANCSYAILDGETGNNNFQKLLKRIKDYHDFTRKKTSRNHM